MDVRGLKLTRCAGTSVSCSRRPLLFNRSLADNLRVQACDRRGNARRAARAQALELHRTQREEIRDHAANARPHALWGRRRQRLSIARALLKGIRRS